jgi:hypothetical protein
METNMVAKDESTLLEVAKSDCDTQIDLCQYWSRKLIKLVEESNMAVDIGGKLYLPVEGWQIIARMAGITPEIEWTRPWQSHDGIHGYEARCILKNREGQIVGSGESSCSEDSYSAQRREGGERSKAVRSASQTFAVSRAIRNSFSYVVKLGNRYESVPLEEMQMTTHTPVAPIPNPIPTPIPAPTPIPTSPLNPNAATYQKISEAQARRLYKLLQISGKSKDWLSRYLDEANILDVKDIKKGYEYETVCNEISRPDNSLDEYEPGEDG